MGVFKIEDNILLAKEVKQYKLLEKDNFNKECAVNTSVNIEPNGNQIIILEFFLKKSFHKELICKIKYDYSKNKIVNSYCMFCSNKGYFPDLIECYHVVYLLRSYSDGLIEGALSKIEIDMLFNNLLEKKRKAELEKIKKENLRYLTLLEKRMNINSEASSIKKASIIPNFECNSFNGIDFETAVDIKIKVDKPYVIKNIIDFIYLINTNGTNQYGKNFTFKHNINNFDAQSKRFLEILINYSYESKWDNPRVKTLSPLVTQDMIYSYKGHNIYLYGESYYVSLDNYEPIIKIKNDQILVENMEYMTIIIGEEYDMIALNGYIYKLYCDEELRYLIRFILGNKNFNFESVKDDFSKKIISRFIDEIELDDNFKEQYSIKDLKIDAYFDYKENDDTTFDVNVIEVKTKYYLDDEEVDEKVVSNNKFISQKYTKYKSIIQELGFIDNKISQIDVVGNFLTCDLENLRKYCTIYLSSNIKDLKVKKLNTISTNISYGMGMLDVCLKDLNFNDEELLKIIKSIRKKAKFVRLSKNVIFKADELASEQLLKIVDEFNLNETKLTELQKVPLYQGMKLMNEESIGAFGNINIDNTVQKMIDEIAHYKEANFDIPNEVQGVLREYQINAFYWLKTLSNYKFCGVLADDMGLGKTLEIITLMLSDNEIKPSLIVCPKSLIYNWHNEVKKWAKSLKAIVISGSADDRKKILETIDNNEKYIYITSYDSLKNDLDLYNEKKFRYCILDEAQFIKNHTTLKAKSVKQIDSEIRFALTGTPIENTVLDLWSLFDFLMPDYLYKYGNFVDDFEKEIISKNNNNAVKKLVRKITPFVLRRTKKEVLKDLPDKIETIRFATMSEEQRKVYEAQLLKTRLEMQSKSSFLLLSELTRLRQLCVHPKMFYEDYKGESCKINLVMELLEDLIPNGHKVLIFSQFTSVFSILESELSKRKIDYFVLTGQTPSIIRMQMAEEFNKPKSSQKVFLISLKAGGTGLNLVGADTVIQLDPWWNVSAENQASDRAHRIGQKNIVQVIKIICEDSIEQKVIELQEAKKDIIDQVIANDDQNITKLSSADLQFLLD